MPRPGCHRPRWPPRSPRAVGEVVRQAVRRRRDLDDLLDRKASPKPAPGAVPPAPSRARARPRPVRRRGAASSATTGSSRFATSRSSSRWCAKTRALTAEYARERPVPVEMVLRHVEQDGHPRPERGGRRVELERRDLDDDDVRGSSTTSSSGRPMLPAATARTPDASSIAVMSVVTVLLPFVPVTATTGTRAASIPRSITPGNGTRRARAANAGWLGRTPGLGTIRSAGAGHLGFAPTTVHCASGGCAPRSPHPVASSTPRRPRALVRDRCRATRPVRPAAPAALPPAAPPGPTSAGSPRSGLSAVPPGLTRSRPGSG